MSEPPSDAAEPHVAERPRHELPTVAGALTTPLPVECLFCFVWRMLDAFGCNATLRWARQWRDARAPRATSLERRLSRDGGPCDCEIFLNSWEAAPVESPRDTDVGPVGSGARESCAGVRRGSTQPCDRWVRRRMAATPRTVRLPD